MSDTATAPEQPGAAKRLGDFVDVFGGEGDFDKFFNGKADLAHVRAWEAKVEAEPVKRRMPLDVWIKVGKDLSPEAQARYARIGGQGRRDATAGRDRLILSMAARKVPQRAIAEAVGLSRWGVRHVLDRHQAQLGDRRTAGQRRQAGAIVNRTRGRREWRAWCEADPLRRGPAVRRAWAASHLLRKEHPRKGRGGGGWEQGLPLLAGTEVDQVMAVAEFAAAYDRTRPRKRRTPTDKRRAPQHRRAVANLRRLRQTISGADLSGTLTGCWSRSSPSAGSGSGS